MLLPLKIEVNLTAIHWTVAFFVNTDWVESSSRAPSTTPSRKSSINFILELLNIISTSYRESGPPMFGSCLGQGMMNEFRFEKSRSHSGSRDSAVSSNELNESTRYASAPYHLSACLIVGQIQALIAISNRDKNVRCSDSIANRSPETQQEPHQLLPFS